MTNANRWLLPDGVDEILPPQAFKLERLRRDILDLYQSWGYDLVIPPLIEFLDSLHIIPSSKLQLRTFQIIDQLTGRSMGIRPDITSQVARIDAHVLKQEGPTRLCYADSVLHTRPGTLLGSRIPIRIGAELYGHAGLDSDVEVARLMLSTLRIAGIENPLLALGHVGIYRGLIAHAELDTDTEHKLFKAIQHKAPGEIENILGQAHVNGSTLSILKELIFLNGDESILKKAEQILQGAPENTLAAVGQMRDMAQAIRVKHPDQALYFDLAELRGYEYHTGLVFAAYVESHGEALSKGGRYDHIGEAFGRARPATGFDTDLKLLLELGKQDCPVPEKVFCPLSQDPALHEKVVALRADGIPVIKALDGQTQGARDCGCTQELQLVDGEWQVIAV